MKDHVEGSTIPRVLVGAIVSQQMRSRIQSYVWPEPERLIANQE